MRGDLLLLATAGVAAAVFTAGLAGASAAAGGRAKSTLAPAINAPWAHERDDEAFDAPAPTAAGLCRSSMFDPANPYSATTNVDVINTDGVQTGGFSNL